MKVLEENENRNENEIENEIENEPIGEPTPESHGDQPVSGEPSTQSTQSEPEELTEDRKESAETSGIPETPRPAQNPQPGPQANPYFQGYGTHPYNPYAQQNPQNQRNPQQNPYGAYRYNPGTQQPYQAPQQTDGQISYTPYPQPAKPKKQPKPVTKGALALVVVLAILLGTGAGIGGALLANRYFVRNAPTEAADRDAVSTAPESPMVIYRASEENAAPTVSTSVEGERLTYSQVAAIVKDAVVEIVTEYNVQSAWFQFVNKGAGSGVVISDDGYIITNAHVIMDEDGISLADSITVRLTDGVEYDAKAVGYDTDADIAVLKIEADNLVHASCGNSDALAVGEELLIVGNPLGELGGTVTNGIVSATEREIQVNGVKMSLIQTNAAVNPGNSGGGMFNMQGQLVGIVNAKSSGSGIEGLGFAIPVNDAIDIAEQLVTYGYVRGKSMIGVTFQDVSNSNYFFYYDIKAGVYVASLAEGYNDNVLKVGDRVIAVNGEEVSTSADIKAIVTASSVGDKLKFQLYRDNKLMEVEVTCYERVPDIQSNIQFEEKGQPEEAPREEFPQDGDLWSGNFGDLPDSLKDFFGWQD